MTDEARRWFVEAGYFWMVLDETSTERADAEVSMLVAHEYETPWYSRLTGFLLPIATGRYTITVQLNVRDASGNWIGHAVASETESQIGSIFLLPIAPFLRRPSTMDLRIDTIRAAILSAHEQGFF
jgi:hypothetical protein